MSLSDWRDFFDIKLGGRNNKSTKSKALIDGYTIYIARCAALDIPPIFENTHLRLMLGLDGADFGALLNDHTRRYRPFKIPKRNGGVRDISAPIPALLYIQKWILRNILNKIDLGEAAHGGIVDRSIVTNARQHLGAKSVLKLDVENFYGSVGFGLGMKVFQRLGYPRNVALSLTQFCFSQGSLPQGAATSPTLANLSCETVDKRCQGLAEKYGLKYTRYFDDLTFSGEFINDRLAEIVQSILAESKFQTNKKKTRLIRGDSTKFVTGISVGGERLRLPRAARRSIRNEAYLLLKTKDVLGFAEAAKNPLVIEVVLGRVAFWHHVEPEDIVAKELFEGLVDLRRETDDPVDLPPAWRPAPMPHS